MNDIKLLMREAEQLGWSFEQRKKHIFGRHKSGLTTTIAASASDKRACDNVRKYLWMTPGRIDELRKRNGNDQ